MYLAAYQLFKLTPCLPILLDIYQYDRTLAGACMSVYAAAGLILSVPLGQRVEKIGLVPLAIGALGLMCLGNLLGVILPESGILMLISRGIEGMAFAGMAIIGPVLANRHVSTRWLPVVVSLTAIWVPVGQLLSTVLAPYAIVHLGWQWLWYFGILLSVFLMLWTAWLSHRGMFALSPQRVTKVSSKNTSVLSPQERYLLMAAAVIFMMFSIQYFAFMTWLPQYLIEAHGLSLSDSIWGYALPVVVVIIVSLITAGLLQSGIKTGSLLVVGTGIITSVWSLVSSTDDVVFGIIPLIIYGIGAGIVPTILFAMPMTITGQGGATASAFGIIMTGRNVGVLIGPVLLAGVFTHTGSWQMVPLVFALVTIIGFMVSIWFAFKLTKRTIKTFQM
jgi:MFS family permease